MPKSGSAIEWTDATWNPMTGCTKISSGCDHCYAERLSRTKLERAYLAQPPVRDSDASRSDPFAPRFWPDRLEQPLRWRKPRRIFVNSMSDIFHAHFNLDMIREVFTIMETATWHQFQVLTKRPKRARRLASKLPWPENVWLGTSVETMDVAHRVADLQAVPAAVRFLSAEPLLGPLHQLDLSGIHWVIGGGESGPGFRPPEPAWARGLRDICKAQGIAFFWKQWGGFTPKAGGREIDGAEWNEYPEPLQATG